MNIFIIFNFVRTKKKKKTSVFILSDIHQVSTTCQILAKRQTTRGEKKKSIMVSAFKCLKIRNTSKLENSDNTLYIIPSKCKLRGTLHHQARGKRRQSSNGRLVRASSNNGGSTGATGGCAKKLSIHLLNPYQVVTLI